MSVQSDIELHLCYPSPRARPIDDAAVKALASSIADGGLLNAITVRKVQRSRNGQMCDAYEVIAGMHRVKAFRRLQRETIPAVVLDVDDLHAELMLIDENLYRNDLTPAERASAQSRRKAIYQQLHPETKVGANQHTPKSLGQDGQGSEAAPRYDEAASEATGQSERTVRRDVTRGEALGEAALAKIARTSLDSGAEMDALIKLPENARQSLIERAAGGEEVSAKAEVQSLVAAGIEAARPSESDHIVDATEMVDAPAAHMAGRVTPAGDLDYSPTPPWATRALVERVLRSAGREAQCKWQTAWEPACGEGHMAEVLREYFREVWATDINARKGYPDCVGGFLPEDGIGSLSGHFDWIITNPPFEDRVLKFMDRALDLAGYGVAMFLQLRYLEGIGRYERIYKDRPPTIVAPFVERVPLVMGRYDPEASTTTAFMWLVWLKGAAPQAPIWIPPGCKAALARPDDAARFTQSPVQRRSSAPPAEAAE